MKKKSAWLFIVFASIVFSSSAQAILIPSGYTVYVSSGTTLFQTDNTTINSGGTLQVVGTLDTKGSLTINGTLTATSATLTLSGTSLQTISGSGILALGSIDVTNQTAVTFSKNISIGSGGAFTLPSSGSGVYTFSAGSIFTHLSNVSNSCNFNGRSVVLKSDNTGTAGLGSFLSTPINATAITAERYVASAGRRWRFLASPLTSRTLANWKSTIHITGNGGTGSGFDDNGFNNAASNSVYTYDESVISGNLNTGWVAATNGSTNTIDVAKGYRVFVRGSRDPGRLTNGILTQDAVTLTLTGGLTSGNVNMAPTFTSSGTLANDGWNFLGNPYPCAFDFNAFHDAGRTGTSQDYSGTDFAHVDAVVYIFDATANSYKSYNAQSDVSSGLTGGIIPSGSGFFVQAVAASPTMTFKETYKTSTAPVALHKAGNENELHIKLETDTTKESDEYILKIADGSTTNFDGYDIQKLENPGVNISSFGLDNKNLTASCIPTIASNDVVPLTTNAAVEGVFKMHFSGVDNFGREIYLFDKFTNTKVLLTENYKLTFAMNSTSGTYGNRFELHFAKTTGVNALTNSKANPIDAIVFPNPASDVLNIKLLNLSAGNESSAIKFFNLAGTEVLNSIVFGNAGTVDIKNLSSGIYFVQITNEHEGFTKTIKLVK